MFPLKDKHKQHNIYSKGSKYFFLNKSISKIITKSFKIT